MHTLLALATTPPTPSIVELDQAIGGPVANGFYWIGGVLLAGGLVLALLLKLRNRTR